MSEEKNKENDTPEVVPKEELDKIKGEYDQLTTDLKTKLEDAKNQLLSEEYLAFLEQKHQNKDDKDKTPSKSFMDLDEIKEEDLNNLKPAQLARYIERKMAGSLDKLVKDSVNPNIQSLAKQIQNMSVYLELQEVKSKHDDFDDYRDEISTILEKSNTDLTMEQAYHMAKGQAGPKDKTPKDTPPKSGERPGGNVPLPSSEKKDFKDANEAAMAAWESVKQKHGIQGDTI